LLQSEVTARRFYYVIAFDEEGSTADAYQNGDPPSLRSEKEGVRKWMNIQKHTRFSSFHGRKHYHTFIELNYMYSGNCLNIVDDRPIRMNTGDLVIIKPGCSHSIAWAGEDDILVNIILLPHATIEFQSSILVGHGKFSAFLVDAVYSDNNVPNFFYLRLGGCSQIVGELNNILCEYYASEQIASEIIIKSCLQCLLGLILRESTNNPEMAVYSRPPDIRLAEIITYIKENCVRCSREQLSERFGYSKNCISSMISKGTGKTFVQLRNEFRLERAKLLLSSTTLPVRTVAEECGFLNISQFYDLYKKCYGHLPRDNY